MFVVVVVGVMMLVVVVVMLMMVVAVVVIVIVVVVVMMMAAAVSASFGSEGRAHERNIQPEATHELVEHVIVLVGEATRRDCERHVSIAEVIRRAREKERVVRGRDAELFVGGDDRVRFAVVGEQAVAIGEHGAARKANRELPTVLQMRAKPRLFTGIVVEDEAAGDGRRRIVVEAADGAHGQNKKYR